MREATAPPAAVFRPEECLVLAAVSRESVSDDELRLHLRSDRFPWDNAVRLATRNRIAGAVARLLAEQPFADFVDPAVHATWREIRSAALLRSAKAVLQLRQLGNLLNAVGIAPLLYKGIDVQERCYDASTPRTFGDLDVIVRSEEAERAVAAMLDGGYVPLYDLPFSQYRRFHLHYQLHHPERPHVVELHWALDSPLTGRFDVIPEILVCAHRDREFGCDAFRASDIDLLLLISHHLEKHLRLAAALGHRTGRLRATLEESGLVWVFDVVGWLRHFTNRVDGDSVLARARSLASERALVSSLRLAMDVAPSALPPWAESAAKGQVRRMPLLCRVLYADLEQPGAGLPLAAPVRRLLMRELPMTGFRALRVVQLLAFGPDSGPESPGARARIAAALRWTRTAVASAFAVIRWKLLRRS